jgi:SecD/SecF fusion protein
MNRNHLYKLILVVLVVAWSVYELTPLQTHNIIDVFKERAYAQRHDADYTNILTKAEELDKQFPDRNFGNLKLAVGTNDLTHYFPFLDTKDKKDPNLFVLNWLQQQAAGKVKLGLDLQGGTSWLLAMDVDKVDTNKVSRTQSKESAIANAAEVIRKRVDALGVAEPLIQPAGDDRILIQLPGLSEADKDQARTNIQKAAFLEFRMVHPNSDDLIREGIAEPGYELMKEEVKQPDGSKKLELVLVNRRPEMTGQYLKRAWFNRDPMTGAPEIEFELNSDGARIFASLTREYAPKGNKRYRLAIVLDGQLYSAPYINSEIPNGRGVITGNFDQQEAIMLAQVLENPLEAPVKIIDERSVDPSLGKDSIKSGLNAALIGTIAVVAFMAVYYLVGGMVANAALALNIVILLGVMCSFGTTLTMPGIAGIVLTIGMAVDANVLIFERIREESAAGKSLRGALSAGYGKAFWTIFDSNLTTLISSVILIKMGTGPVKGFGVTLTIGLLVSMFTALVVTRLFFDAFISWGWIKSLPMLHIIKGSKIDFMKWAKPAFAVSWCLILIGIAYGIYRGKDVLGYEFAGGDNMTLSFTEKAGVDQLRGVIGKLGVGDVMIQYQKDMGSGKENLRVTTRAVEEKSGAANDQTSKKVLTALQQNFPNSHFTEIGVESVGPTVGKEIQRTAIVSLILSLFGILIYVAFRYEFSFAVGAVVAIIHDIGMTLGWFFLSGRELSATMVAAILTIVGFSINDTIVIFDRIREDLKLGIRGSFKDVMNQALNQTLSRTLITSGTVFLATLALYIFGGGVINDFAFTFLVGILTGTYSSIYIASALVLWWHHGNRPKSAGLIMTGETSAETNLPKTSPRTQPS